MKKRIGLIAFAIFVPLVLSAGYLVGTGNVEVIDPTEEMTITCGTVADGGGIQYVPATVDAGAGTIAAGQEYRWKADPNSDGVMVCYNRGCTTGIRLSTSPEAFALGSSSGTGLQRSNDAGVSSIHCVAASGTASVSIHPIHPGTGK